MISGRKGIYICPLLNMPCGLLPQVILGFNLVTGVCSTAIPGFTCTLTKAPHSVTQYFFFFSTSSFLSLKGKSCPPHQFFKAHIKVIEICCLKKRWRTCGSWACITCLHGVHSRKAPSLLHFQTSKSDSRKLDLEIEYIVGLQAQQFCPIPPLVPSYQILDSTYPIS